MDEPELWAIKGPEGVLSDFMCHSKMEAYDEFCLDYGFDSGAGVHADRKDIQDANKAGFRAVRVRLVEVEVEVEVEGDGDE